MSVSLVLKCLLVILTDNADQQQCKSSEMCLWDPRFFSSLGFPSFLIAYNILILLLKLSILVKMRAAFTWICKIDLVYLCWHWSTSQTSCALVLELHLLKLDIPLQQSAPKAGAYQCHLHPGNQLATPYLEGDWVYGIFYSKAQLQRCQICLSSQLKNNAKSLTFSSGFEGLL